MDVPLDNSAETPEAKRADVLSWTRLRNTGRRTLAIVTLLMHFCKPVRRGLAVHTHR